MTLTARYLTFMLADEVYAVDITKVREVPDFTAATRVPRMSEFMRGSVVPEVDLRLKFARGTQ